MKASIGKYDPGNRDSYAVITKTWEGDWPAFVKTILAKVPETDDKASPGWICGAEFNNGRRHGSNFVARHFVSLDYDHIEPTDVDKILAVQKDTAFLAYTTWSHTPDKPRLRVWIPLDRGVSAEEYQAISRAVASRAGINLAARESHTPAQVMFRPAHRVGGVFAHWADTKSSPLKADAILDEYIDWQDRAFWPRRLDEQDLTRADKASDPRDKPGLIGEFCRKFSISEAIERFELPYTHVGGERWTYTQGSRPEGAIVYDEDTKLHSHHDTDPASGQHNAFDLVRLHKYGDLDAGAGEKPVTERPSYHAMLDYAAALPEFHDLYGAGFTDLGPEEPEPEKLVSVQQEKLVAPHSPRALVPVGTVPGILKDGNDVPMSNVYNAHLYLRFVTRNGGHPAIRYDTFSESMVCAGEQWTDVDDVRMQALLQQHGLRKLGKDAARDACDMVARDDEFSSVEEWLRGLKWDGVKRLTTWVPTAFGVPADRLGLRTGRNWLIAMVRRALEPGCKVDEVFVLEGYQGTKKTSAFEILGGEWFKELTADSKGKDFEQQLGGVWLGEFSELATIKRPEDVERVKQFITCRTDHYRPSYGRRVIDRDRRVVFCASTNEEEWIHDTTGGRRFIPIPATKIDTAWLRANREQLFAEALREYDRGRTHWHYPAGKTKVEQEARSLADPWTEAIAEYLRGKALVKVSDILNDVLHMSLKDRNRSEERRVASALKKLGCIKHPKKRFADGGRASLWETPLELQLERPSQELPA